MVADVSAHAMSGTGSCRRVTDEDRALLTDWFDGFRVDTGEPAVHDPARTVADRDAAGHFWIRDDAGPVAMAALTEPVAKVRRVQAVYTPPENRHRGDASSVVATMYRAVAEVTRYAFD